MTIPPHESQRRKQPRRIRDRVLEDQCKTLSTCLELIASAMLLDHEMRVLYTTPQVDQIMNQSGMPFAITPKFTLHDAGNASRFAAFVNGKNTEKGPISLLLGGENNHDTLLLTCFRLPAASTPGLNAAMYLITLRDPSHLQAQQWRIFTTQFTLTPAEARLCLTLLNGLTLKDYCNKWRVTISTARSQLRSVFAKTDTRRQSELMRMMYLFMQT